jgi:ATP-dependent RNA helicase RhlE
MEEQPTPGQSGFHELGIEMKIQSALEAKGIHVPTPIQHASIQPALEGKDLVGIAQTGTGKTFAFGLPMLQRLSKEKGRGLIIVPTRELAQQAEESLSPIARLLGIGIAVFIGGASMHLQRMMLKRNPRILIATPGRLIDHLERKTVTLHEVAILVLDEADRMLDMGFAPQLKKIMAVVPKERQTLLFSATMPHEIMQLATHYMKLPVRIEVAPAGTAAEHVEQAMLVMRKEEKLPMLEKLLEDFKETALVFVRTKHGAKKLTAALRAKGHHAAEIHANRSLSQRRAALAGFKNGTYRILVATDIAARGIDVTNIGIVVNFDLPDNPEEYVHRIGRTGRAGREGKAVSFALTDQRGDIRTIERLIRKTIPLTVLPSSIGMPEHHESSATRNGNSRASRAPHGRRHHRRRFR